MLHTLKSTLLAVVASTAAVLSCGVTEAETSRAGKPGRVNIVAVGASNTSGWGVTRPYPMQLEALLKAKGYDVQVVNAGIVLDTTAGMLRRIDDAAPDGTHIVILQPGGNDRRFFVSAKQRSANIDAMVQRLRKRGIAVIVHDPEFPSEHYQWDRIHINADGHARIASDLLPKVISAIRSLRR